MHTFFINTSGKELENYEGFFHVCDIEGNESLTTIFIIIRDHDKQKFEEKKELIVKTVCYLNSIYGDNTFVADIKDSYYNMKDALKDHMHIVERAKDAFTACGVTPFLVPIRGGTDGARLSWRGLPCPNLSTGGMNGHGQRECACIEDMEKMVDVLCEIVRAK